MVVFQQWRIMQNYLCKSEVITNKSFDAISILAQRHTFQIAKLEKHLIRSDAVFSGKVK